jgi:hypothetical protein
MKKIKTFQDFLLEFNVGKISIENMDKYLDGMRKGMNDKLFFLDKIDIDVLVDFGSADGHLLNYLSTINSDIKLIGYDIDENMINTSKKKYPHIHFTDNWEEIMKLLNEKYKDKVKGILLSSVIHEVYSYAGGKNTSHFWKQVFNRNFDYVIIRDMICSSNFGQINPEDIKKVREKSDPKMLQEFEEHWGKIDDSFRTLLHWLLKYRYADNWKRELKENYLPITIEYLKSKRIPNDWNIIFEEHYLYDFIKQQVKKDFDIDLKEKTHLKMIIKRKKGEE